MPQRNCRRALALASPEREAYYGVWRKYGYTPEGFNLAEGRVNAGQKSYPLRPELIESTLYLWQATADPHYIEVGRDMLASLELTRVPCGHAAVGDVDTHILIDRMDSYFLSETLKYLYLLFSPGHWAINGSFVFTTEGHPLPIVATSSARAAHAGAQADAAEDTSFRSLRNSYNPFYRVDVSGEGRGEGTGEWAGAPDQEQSMTITLHHIERELAGLPHAKLQDAARKHGIDPDAPSSTSLLQSIMEHLRASYRREASEVAEPGGPNAEAESPEQCAANGGEEGGEEGGWVGGERGPGGMHGLMLYLDGNTTAALDQLMRARY